MWFDSIDFKEGACIDYDNVIVIVLDLKPQILSFKKVSCNWIYRRQIYLDLNQLMTYLK